MVIESKLSGKWDTTKTKRYTQKCRDDLHMTSSVGREGGSFKFWLILYFWSKSVVFF